MKRKFKYIFVSLSSDAVSFCLYKNKIKDSVKTEIMTIDNIRAITEYAQGNQYPLFFLYGESRPDKNIEDIISSTSHNKIIPIDLADIYKESIIVANSDQKDKIASLNKSNTQNLILHIKRKDINRIKEFVLTAMVKVKRLNLFPLDIQNYTDENLDTYKEQLSLITPIVAEEYKKGNALEFNFLSDRILLNRMNNCNAGLDHITFAPNGKFYLCPAFYNDNKNDSIGTIQEGITIKDEKELEIAQAPICSICDAYHCKRCYYLNKKITLEINTPSYQQCVLSHYERNESKKLYDSLRAIPGFHDFDNLPTIPEIDYVDPYKVIIGEIDHAPKNIQKQMGMNELKKTINQEFQPVKKLNTEKRALPENKKTGKQGRYNESDGLEDLTTKALLIKICRLLQEVVDEFKK